MRARSAAHAAEISLNKLFCVSISDADVTRVAYGADNDAVSPARREWTAAPAG